MKRIEPAFRLLLAGAFVVLLACAAAQRFSLPLTPIFDPDSPGYVNPAISHLSGQGFQQTQGRSFLYPALVLGVLNATGNLKSIVVMQHVASLLAGVAWMGILMVWSSLLPRGYVRSFVAPLIGLAAVGFYLTGAETIMFGLQVRPEAVFPLAGALQILCLMIFIKVRWPDNGAEKSLWILASGIGAVFFSAAACNLKPSWGFAILVTPIVLGAGIVFRPSGESLKRAAAPLVSGCILTLLLMTGIPAALQWKRDEVSKSFLAMNIFAVHANIISDYLQEKVDAGKATAGEAEFSQRLRAGIEESRHQTGRYVLLGHNPDYLMYESSTLVSIPGVSSLEERRNYYFRTLFSSMARYPDRYILKWLTQLRAAFFQDPKYLSRPSGNLQKLYGISKPFPSTPYPAMRADLAHSYSETAAETACLVADLPDATKIGPKWLKKAGEAGAVLYPLSFLTGLILAAMSPFFFRTHLLAVLAASLVSAAAFLSAMTVAFVHSFDIDRYLSLQSWLAWLTISCWTAVVLSLVESQLRGQFPTAKADREKALKEPA
jgi:hypothetical protein